jgi:hypothetical protein
VYVDCSAGNNSNAGTRSAPLRTIASALQRSPSSGATLAVCVKGTCASGTESFPLSPPAGLTGSYSRSTSPSENAPFNFPTKPTILSGWDANGDGNYPPASGETAALDGGNTALEALNLPGRMELAHLTVQKFANTTAAQNQYTYVASINDGAQYVYVHDTTWDQIHQATALSLGSGEWIIFPLYGNPGPVARGLDQQHDQELLLLHLARVDVDRRAGRPAAHPEHHHPRQGDHRKRHAVCPQDLGPVHRHRLLG